MRLIDVDAFIADAKMAELDTVEKVFFALVHQPIVEPKHGEWIEKESNHVEKIYICSNCNNYEAWGEPEKSPYCPNCGAKMEW